MCPNLRFSTGLRACFTHNPTSMPPKIKRGPPTKKLKRSHDVNASAEESAKGNDSEWKECKNETPNHDTDNSNNNNTTHHNTDQVASPRAYPACAGDQYPFSEATLLSRRWRAWMACVIEEVFHVSTLKGKCDPLRPLHMLLQYHFYLFFWWLLAHILFFFFC